MRHQLFRHSMWLIKMRHGARGAGAFSFNRGGGFGDGDEFSRSRKFSSDDLQLLIVGLLMEGTRHGYEMIKLLEARSNGFYTPSPGMIYPALTYLEEVGFTSVAVEGNRKSYSLTPQGRDYFEANRERIEVLWAKLNFFGRKMGLVRRALAGDDADEPAANRPLKELMDARHRLKHQLFALSDASPEEQMRVARIIERAIVEIAAIAGKEPKEH